MGANALAEGTKAATAAEHGPPPPPHSARRPKRHGGKQSALRRDAKRAAERDARDAARLDSAAGERELWSAKEEYFSPRDQPDTLPTVSQPLPQFQVGDTFDFSPTLLDEYIRVNLMDRRQPLCNSFCVFARVKYHASHA